jgi:lipid-binding SYLF domain-containing protein
MRHRVALLGFFAATALALGAAQAHAQAREEGRLLEATQVLDEVRESRDQFIPDRLLERAYGIAVLPNVTKAAFVLGGRYGEGVLVVRDKNGRFTNPIFIRIGGGSFGWQAGVQSTDIVLVFTTRAGIEGITDGKLTLGADASVAAGPVGRQATAATDASFSAEVYSYSRARGLFAGVALDGTALTINARGNAAFYKKKGVTASDIINGAVTTDAEGARRFLSAIGSSTSHSATGPASKTHTTDGGTTPPAPPSGEARTFPMEDQKPGEEPK